ncbi:MAG: MMPL family transporter [Lachnospiraceae bacterium]|nr:MMPL family transporter [Lachnospiraceae bacterium]MCH4030611.1 MMPL family transporter [Lachnospiraceae bacterium]MCH4069820.1 MMPL family transporter [Lachnospiraceae bacterium]MCH4107241.1 MMPL family transporter [Lachnospiraceae bacterium]MCI1301904.1 MMPL family transporter [Lachnospiraceae bacterium]
MVKVGKWIAKNRILILILAVLLLIPSYFGFKSTRTNYDLLTYLPENLDTVQGQNIVVDQYGMGAFSMVVVENKSLKDVAKLEQDIEAIPHVKNVLWYDDVADINLPVEMIPEKLRSKFFSGDATMMLVLLDNTSSADSTLEAEKQIRSVLDQDCYINGIPSVMNDLKDLTDQELPIYVGIAVLMSLIAMLLLTDSFVVPFLFLLDIAFAVVYNMGTNVMFGSISYITKAIAAVLQLAVTMDYSIFLLGSYRENKQRFPGDNNRAMGHAIANTFKSIIGSSVTTIAGFVALCFMSFTLGLDLGLVMAKGVLFGVISCVTILPSLVLFFDKAIEKTRHKPLLGRLDKASNFITKHYKLWIVLFCIILVPAIYGNNHVQNYYDMSGSLPSDLPSRIGFQKVEDDFGSTTIDMVLFDKNMPAKEKADMLSDLENVDGVNYCLGMNSLVGSNVPDSMVPLKVRNMLQSDKYEMCFVGTGYYVGSDEANAQVEELNSIIKKYDADALLVGEAPMTHDLVDVTNVDFIHVNSASLGIIFVIIMLLFRSVSLPVILELVIESAIIINMSVPYFTNTSVVFVASIILGTVQLGSTVDYAILMTSRYQKERQRGRDRDTAIQIAHRTSMSSIITSGISFFAATFGVALYSNIDVIHSMCLMLARGALISTVVVIFILPGMLKIFGGLIEHTSWHFLGRGSKEKTKSAPEAKAAPETITDGSNS